MIRLATISEGVNTWPLYAAQAKAFWKQAGVEVEITVTGSSARQLEALKSGGYEVGFQQVDHIVRGVEEGADLFIFMGQSHAPELSLIAAPEIQRIEDLKGKVIVVDGARTGYSLLLRKLFKDHGFAESDMRLTEFGGSQERFDAMKRGAGAACFINPPFDRNLVAAGFRNMGASRDFFPTYPGPIAAARRSWAATHEAELVAFIRGFNAAYAWLHDKAHRDEAVRLLPARLNMEPAAAAAALKRIYSRPRPQVTEDGVRQVMDVVWDSEGYTAAKGAPEKYMNLDFLARA